MKQNFKKTDKYEKGDYRLVIAESEEDGKRKYYLSNCSGLIESKEIVKIYKCRREIEKFFQVAKNNFGAFGCPKDVYRREIRVITKLIGIVLFLFNIEKKNKNKW